MQYLTTGLYVTTLQHYKSCKE